MAIRIGTPNVDWMNWMRLYNEAVDSNKDSYQSDWNKLMQGIGLTLTEWNRAKKNAEWNQYIKDNPNSSFEDMYRKRLEINGGF